MIRYYVLPVVLSVDKTLFHLSGWVPARPQSCNRTNQASLAVHSASGTVVLALAINPLRHKPIHPKPQAKPS